MYAVNRPIAHPQVSAVSARSRRRIEKPSVAGGLTHGQGSGNSQEGVLKAFRTKRIVTKVHIHLGLTCIMRSV